MQAFPNQAPVRQQVLFGKVEWSKLVDSDAITRSNLLGLRISNKQLELHKTRLQEELVQKN